MKLINFFRGLKILLAITIINVAFGSIVAQSQGCVIAHSPKDIIILCAQLSVNTSPALSQTGDLGLDGVTPNFYGATDGSVSDCVNYPVILKQRYIDFIFSADCSGIGAFNDGAALPNAKGLIANGIPSGDVNNVVSQISVLIGSRHDVIKIFIRQFFAFDYSPYYNRNESTPTYQIIGVMKATQIRGPNDKIISCVDSVSLDPKNLGYPEIIDPITKISYPISYNSNTCEVSAQYSDSQIGDCGLNKQITRTWFVFNGCSNAPPQTYIQHIFFVGSVNWSAKTYSRSASKLCYTDLWNVQNILSIFDTLTEKTLKGDFNYRFVKTNSLGIENTPSPGATVLNALSNGNNCGGKIVINFTNTCNKVDTLHSNYQITCSDSRFKITTAGNNSYRAVGVFNDNNDGNPINVTFAASDACGLVILKTDFSINLNDNAAPEPVCIFNSKVSLDENGRSRLDGSALNSGSRDNCAIKQIFVRRKDGLKPDIVTTNLNGSTCGNLVTDTCSNNLLVWKDFVEFGCADVGNTVVVMLGILDYANNFNVCMVNVQVENKIIPICTPPPDVTYFCYDATTQLYLLDSVNLPQVWHNCPGVQIKTLTILDSCKTGDFTRNWEVSDCKGMNTVSCSQTVTFTKITDFTVDFPDDITVSSLDSIPTKESLRRQMLDSTSWSEEKDGAILNEGCDVLSVNITDKMFSEVPTVCPKIVRKISVIDFCKFNPNYESIDYNIEYYGRPTYGDYHGYGDNSGKYTQTVLVSGSEATNAATWENLYLSPNWYDAGTNTKQRRFRDADYFSDSESSPQNYTATGDVNTLHPYAYSDGIICFSQIIQLIDTIFPILHCVDSKIVNFRDSTGSDAITALSIISSVSDNCTTETDLRSTATITLATDSTAGNSDSISFTCADYLAASSVYVKIWLKDGAGNYTTCKSNIILQDTLGACDSFNSFALIKGFVATENNQALANVKVTVTSSKSGSQNVTITNANGGYSISELKNLNCHVHAQKTSTEDKYIGVSTYDIALISKHILGITLLKNPYQIIAADVDKSNEIDAADMLTLRRFILNIDTKLPAGVWRFIDKSYSFKNALNPFGEDFPEVVNVFNNKTAKANFVAVKVGDVNQSYTPAFTNTATRSAKTVELSVEKGEWNSGLIAGKEYNIKINADNLNAQSLQGTFEFKNATVKAIKSGELNNMGDANFGLFNEAVTMSWNSNANEGMKELKNEMFIAEITFVVNITTKLSNILTFGSSKTPAIANDANGNEDNVVLKFDDSQLSTNNHQLTTISVVPNPAKERVTVVCRDVACNVSTIRVLDLLGKELIVQEINSFSIDLDISHLATGCYIVELTSNGERFVEKFLKQ